MMISLIAHMTVRKVNAYGSVGLYVIRVAILGYFKPYSDNRLNLAEFLASSSHLVAAVWAAMPVYYGGVDKTPELFTGWTGVWIVLVGPSIAAGGALLGMKL